MLLCECMTCDYNWGKKKGKEEEKERENKATGKEKKNIKYFLFIFLDVRKGNEERKRIITLFLSV